MDTELAQLLTGKQLLMEEIPVAADRLVGAPIHIRPGLEEYRGYWKCNRCGNHERHRFAEYPCARCGQTCVYCRHCLMMGRVSSCSKLYSWSGPPLPTSEATLKWSGTLSRPQADAAEQVVQTIQRQQELLVWAVCGAGKTELLFPGIEVALKRKMRVCIATPRTDVVHELTPRLQAVFPNLHVTSLYGGTEDRHTFSPLTVATTHQLIRFYQAFDVMIVDEVDAFPFTADPALLFAVQQARKPTSALIYLTATPSRSWQRECKARNRPFVTIPARFHRHPLPVPNYVWCGNWEKRLNQGKIPQVVLSWIKSRIDQKIPLLLFVPEIAFINPVVTKLREIAPTTQGVFAEDPDRKEKVQLMRRGEIGMLVTTTILERGVTFKGVHVAVLGADDRIFTEAALVQISGRVGRSSESPDGNVTFFHSGKTEAMVRARRQIIEMNREARDKGLILN